MPRTRSSFLSSSHVYTKYVELYTHRQSLHSGKKLHARIIAKGLQSSNNLSSKLIVFYVRCGQISIAYKVFDEMPQTDTRWISLVNSFSRCELHNEVLGLFYKMQVENIKVNEYIVPNILKACANTSDSRTGKLMHGIVFRTGLVCDSIIVTSLIDFYSKHHLLDYARYLFDEMVERDTVSWNVMISVYAQHGMMKIAMNLVEQMRSEGIYGDLVTWNSLISGFSRTGDNMKSLELIKCMEEHGIDPDVVSWTSIISGFVQNLCYSKAFSVFRKMVQIGVKPNSDTLSSILPACANVTNVKQGKEIHGYTVVIGVEEDVFVSTCLVDMYSKCGFIVEAGKIFDKMPKRNTVTFNSMIFGYANHGHCEKAISLFDLMVNEKIKPDHLTFTSMFMACSHAGLVERGQNMFISMQKVHGIFPRLEHYACMVDLLGRAGKLEEAHNFIKRMPMKADCFVWGSLLGACKKHGNIDLAKIATSHLLKLEPKGAGSYLLLSNLFADVGRWEDSARLKTMIKKEFEEELRLYMDRDEILVREKILKLLNKIVNTK